MLSDEEKKAINNMKLFARVHQDMTVVTANEMDIVLNLIEKQQKEIEGLVKVSKECIEEKFNNDNMWEDKIKAKIGRIEDLHLSEDYKDYVISVLQSLLKGE